MGVWADPIRPGKPGRREGGEASWMPQIGQGKPRACKIFWGPMKHGQIDPLALDPEHSADLHLLGGDHRNQEVSGQEGPAEHFSRACTELGTAPSMGDSPNKAWMVCPCP